MKMSMRLIVRRLDFTSCVPRNTRLRSANFAYLAPVRHSDSGLRL